MNSQSESTDASAAKKPMMSAKERLLEYGDRTGPGTPARRVFGDVSAAYALIPAFIYVVLSEGGSKGVEDHDRVASLENRGNVAFEDIMGRLVDTLDLIAGMMFATGTQRDSITEALREIHRHIGGTLEDGRRYHAWNKNLWAWTWAGILKPPLDAYEILHGPVSREFAQDYYVGVLQLGDLIGVRGLPETYTEFLHYWEEVWIPQTRVTGTGQYIYSLLYDTPRPAAAPWIPRPVWDAMSWPIRHALATSAFLVMEPRILQMLEMKPTRAQQISVSAQRRLWRALPTALTRGWSERVIGLRLRYGNHSWNRHYSPQALTAYSEQIEQARAHGCPHPARPSARH